MIEGIEFTNQEWKHEKDIKPLGDNVLVQMIEDELTHSGLSLKSGPRGVIICPSHHDKNRVVKAKVIAIGERVLDIKVDDTVILRLLSGKRINDFNLVHQDIILGVVNEASDCN